MRASKVLVVALVVAAVGFVLAGAMSLIALGDRKPVTRASVGVNVFVNPPAMIDANNSPTLARNPRRPDNLVVGHRVDRPRFSASLQWSDNAGATWHPTALPLPPEDDRPYAPDVVFGPDGTLYVLYVNLQGVGNDPENLWLATSTDGGRTLSAPVRVGGPLTFQARIAVDAEGTIFVTWMAVEDVGTLSILGPTRIVAVRSTDGGATFSEPRVISDEARERVGAAEPVIDSEGDLVVVYQDFKDDRRDFENLEGPPWEEPFALVVTRSDDGGRSFGPGREFESGLVPVRRFLVYLPELPSVAAGPDRSIYVAWSDGRNGDEDVFLRRSGDGGRTWAEPVRVHDNPVGDGTTQHLPAVDVDADGRVSVAFLDRRHDPDDVMSHTYMATSSDGGRSFTDVRLSSGAFDTRVGPMTAPHLGVDLGSRIGISSVPGQAVAVWTDTRLGSEDTGRQDIAAATVTFIEEGAGGGSPAPLLAVAAAAIVGLAILAGIGLRWRARGSVSRSRPAGGAS